MAGDWIKLRLDIFADMAVRKTARRLGVDPFAIVGRLAWLWTDASRGTEKGHIPFSAEMIDADVGLPGFCAALADEGWLEIHADSVTIPEFDRYCSSAKLREKERDKKRRQRKSVSQGRPRGQGGDNEGTKGGTGGGRSPSPSLSISLGEGCRGGESPTAEAVVPSERVEEAIAAGVPAEWVGREWTRFLLYRGVDAQTPSAWRRWVKNFDPALAKASTPKGGGSRAERNRAAFEQAFGRPMGSAA